MSSNNGDDFFAEARNQFLESLSPKESSLFSKCSSPEELLQDIEKFNGASKDKRFLRKIVQKVKTLSDSLSPYFDAVGIIIQSNPEFAALAWGGVRFILQLASNYVTFFEKLANTLQRLGGVIPQYDILLDLWKKENVQPSPRLRASLINVYRDLFQFFKGVTRIFLRKDGGK